jgi:hypothetical protein
VDDPLVVSGGEAVGNLEREVEGLAYGKRSTLQSDPEVWPSSSSDTT